MEENEEEEDDDENYHEFYGYSDTSMGEAEGKAVGEAHDKPADDLGRTIADARRDCESEKESEKFDKMLEDHNKLLYPTCENGLKNWVAHWNCYRERCE